MFFVIRTYISLFVPAPKIWTLAYLNIFFHYLLWTRHNKLSERRKRILVIFRHFVIYLSDLFCYLLVQLSPSSSLQYTITQSKQHLIVCNFVIYLCKPYDLVEIVLVCKVYRNFRYVMKALVKNESHHIPTTPFDAVV